MDGYADDLAAVIEALDLRDATLVGHSTGGGEVARYIGRHGTGRVAKAVLLGAVPPIMVRSADNPEGLPIEVFDGLRKDIAATARNSTGTSRFPSTARTGRAPTSRKACSTLLAVEHAGGPEERL